MPARSIVVMLLLLAGGLGAAGWWAWDDRQMGKQMAKVSARSSRFTLEKDDGANLPSVKRSSRPLVYFRVTLVEAPLGRRLPMDCVWLDPRGTVVHQNHYKTRRIDKAVWTTHARHQFGPASPQGEWTVRMSLGGRELRTAKITVED
jgi:hypothetical protein